MYLCCRAFLPADGRRSGSVVIAIGSMTGKRPLWGRAPYAAEQDGAGGSRPGPWPSRPRPTGVRVNLVSPGPVEGERIEWVFRAQARGARDERGAGPPRWSISSSPLGRLVAPEDVAAAAVLLASTGPPRSPARTSMSRRDGDVLSGRGARHYPQGGSPMRRLIDLSQVIYRTMKVYPGHLKTVHLRARHPRGDQGAFRERLLVPDQRVHAERQRPHPRRLVQPSRPDARRPRASTRCPSTSSTATPSASTSPAPRPARTSRAGIARRRPGDVGPGAAPGRHRPLLHRHLQRATPVSPST